MVSFLEIGFGNLIFLSEVIVTDKLICTKKNLFSFSIGNKYIVYRLIGLVYLMAAFFRLFLCHQISGMCVGRNIYSLRKPIYSLCQNQ